MKKHMFPYMCRRVWLLGTLVLGVAGLAMLAGAGAKLNHFKSNGPVGSEQRLESRSPIPAKPRAALGAATQGHVGSQANVPASLNRLRLVRSYGKLPLSFEANHGQTSNQVKFLSRGRGYALFLTDDEAVLVLKKSSVFSGQTRIAPTFGSTPAGLKPGATTGEVAQYPQFGAAALPELLTLRGAMETSERKEVEKPRDRRAGPALPFSSRHLADSGEDSAVLRMRLVGANARAGMAGAEELPGKSNYIIGNDPKKWHTNVPTYAKVKYQDIYPGVDLVYYGNQGGQLEYDFVVAPGADPSLITLDVAAGSPCHLQIASDGDLMVKADDGEVRFHKPLVYQPTINNGQRTTDYGQRTTVDGRYVLQASNHVGFKVASYDRTRPLIIDPVLTYSTYLGGNDSDSAVGIAVDSSGNAYVAGDTSSTNFPTVNPVQGNLEGGANIFVTKMNAQGSALVYSTYLGGSSAAGVSALAVDTSGNAYVSGLTSSPNFPTVNALQPSLESSTNLFLAKLSVDGSSLVYSTYLGGSAINQFGNFSVDGVAADAAGNAYVVGNTTSEDFVTTPGAYEPNCPEPFDFRACVANYVLKVSADGSSLLYSTFVGSGFWYTSGAITADAAGNAYVTAAGYDPTSPNPGITEVFKIDPQGTGLVYDTGIIPVDYIEATSIDPSGIAIDPAGNAYVIGLVNFNRLPATPGAFQTSCMPSNPDSCQTGFVTKFDGNGNIVYSTYLGASDGSGGVFPTAIAADPNGNAYVVGGAGPNLPLLNPFVATPPSGGTFVTVLNPTGTGLVYSSYLFANAGSIAVDGSSNAYLTGSTGSTDLPVTPGAFQTSLAGVIDAFVAKVSPLTPVANAAPSTLTFGSEQVGTSSAPMLVTLSDTGTAPLTVNSIAASGDFTQTNNCGGSLAPDSSCTIDVDFAPSASGTRTGTLTITDNNNGFIGSQQTVSLSGTGTGLLSKMSVSPTSLSFGNQPLNMTSGLRPVTVTNTGTAPLTVSSVAASAEYADTSTCTSPVNPGGTCTLNISFTPTALGTQTGTVTLNSNASNDPQVVNLTGNGFAGAALSCTNCGFGRLAVGTSGGMAITVANAQNVALTNINVTINGSHDYSQTNTCGTELGARRTCTITVTLTPSIVGADKATLTVTDSATNSPQTATLLGEGLVSPAPLQTARSTSGK